LKRSEDEVKKVDVSKLGDDVVLARPLSDPEIDCDLNAVENRVKRRSVSEK